MMRPLFALLLACACAYSAVAEEKKEPREGGILGTGIVGTITQLGSIYVNDQHIRFDKDLIARTAFGPRQAATLKPGETVIVHAVRDASDWRATDITLYHPLIGPVTRHDGELHVMGSRVEWAEAEMTTPDGIEDGDWVAVSGLWKGDAVVASLIEEVTARPRATIIGSYIPGNSDVFQIGGTSVNQISLEHVKTGDVLTVQGRPEAGALSATNVKIGLFETPVTHIIAQGYLSKPDSEGLYTVLGSGAVSFTDAPTMISGEEFGVFCNELQARGDLYTMTPLEAGTCPGL